MGLSSCCQQSVLKYEGTQFRGISLESSLLIVNLVCFRLKTRITAKKAKEKLLCALMKERRKKIVIKWSPLPEKTTGRQKNLKSMWTNRERKGAAKKRRNNFQFVKYCVHIIYCIIYTHILYM